MSSFSFTNYALIFLSIFSHYSLGRRLRIHSFVLGSMVGVGASALVVACLTNVCAGLIRPYLCLSTGLWAVLTIFDLVHLRIEKNHLITGALMASIGLFFFFHNRPQDTFFYRNQSGEPVLIYNYHYTSRSSHNTEMLRANYFSRLKQAICYPHTFSNNNFFTAAFHAVPQALIREPGFLTHLMTQTVLLILIMVSILEAAFSYLGFSLPKFASILVGLGLGITLFAPNLNSIGHTGIISLFAIIQVFLALLLGKPQTAMTFAFLLLASQMRVVPLALFCIVGMFLLFYEKKSLSEIRKLNGYEWISLALIGIYSALTVGLGSANQGIILNQSIFDPSSHWRLFSYRILGYILSPLYHYWGHGNRFYLFNRSTFYGQFDKIPHGSFPSYLFICFLVGFAVYLARAVWRHRTEAPKWLSYFWAATVVLLFGSFFVSRDRFFFNLITLPYLWAVCFLGVLWAKRKKYNHKCLAFLLGFQCLAMTILHSPVTQELKNPLNDLGLELPLWPLSMVFLLTGVSLKRQWVHTATIAACLFGFLTIQPGYLLPMAYPHIPSSTPFINLGPLLSSSFRRSDFVDDNNFLKADIEWVGGQWRLLKLFETEEDRECTKLEIKDVYASVLGAHVRCNLSDPCNDNVPNFTFIKPVAEK